jgi:hypothetical protein
MQNRYTGPPMTLGNMRANGALRVRLNGKSDNVFVTAPSLN